jgi:hypothetical protein
MLASLVERIQLTADPAPRTLGAAWSLAVDGTAAIVGWARRAQCGLLGHEMIRRIERDRIALECLASGAQSPGWSLR